MPPADDVVTVPLAGKAHVSGEDHHFFSHRSLGGWLDHSFFVVETMNAGRPCEFVYRTYSMGQARNANPNMPVSGNATWSGIMSGVVKSHSGDAGSFVNGDATMTVTDLGSSSDASVNLEYG